MKIRMMTFHTPKNYGAVLQAYALQTHLKKLVAGRKAAPFPVAGRSNAACCGSHCSLPGDDVKILDFFPESLKKKYDLLFPTKHSWAGFALKCIQLPFKLLDFDLRESYRRFDAFAADHFDLTERYSSLDELESQFPECNLVITGSDQIFNPNRRPHDEHRAFYLDFDTRKAFRASYAASFGVEKIPERHRDRVASFLNRFDALSVREEIGRAFVETLTSRKAVVSLDPVFLLEKSEWEALAGQSTDVTTGRIQRPYLLYFALNNYGRANEHIQRIAKKYGWKVVVMSHRLFPGHRALGRADHVIRNAGPLEFLQAVRHADYVFTDSFHGTAFSVIMEKPFTFFHEIESKTLRSRQLLRVLGKEGSNATRNLEHRILSPSNAFAPEDSAINDTDEIRNRLAEARQESMTYLAEVLRKAECRAEIVQESKKPDNKSRHRQSRRENRQKKHHR